MSQQSQQSTDDEEENYHICGETGGVIYEYPGCGEKLHYEDTCMVGCTSFCIGCYEEIEEEDINPMLLIQGYGSSDDEEDEIKKTFIVDTDDTNNDSDEENDESFHIEIKPDPEPEIKIE